VGGWVFLFKINQKGPTKKKKKKKKIWLWPNKRENKQWHTKSMGANYPGKKIRRVFLQGWEFGPTKTY